MAKTFPKYPVLLRVEKVGSRVCALDALTGEDFTRLIYYATLQNAFKRGHNI